MARAFDLVHKIAGQNDQSESRIPFEDDDKAGGSNPEPGPKKRPRIEIAFFYILLFVVFFIMGMAFLSPNLFAGILSKEKPKAAQASPSPVVSPDAGFAITKEGQSAEEAAKELGVKNSPSPTSSSNTATTTEPEPTESSQPTKSTGARIQVLNGTTKTGAAATLRTKLANKGIIVETIGNHTKRTVKRTTIYYDSDYKTAAQQVLSVSGGIMIESASATGEYDIVVIIGQSS